jgi:hypothetical protein
MTTILEEPAASPDWEFIVLGSGQRLSARLGVSRTHLVSKAGQLDRAILGSSDDSLWIVTQPNLMQSLIKAASSRLLGRQGIARSLGNLLLLRQPPQSTAIPSLHSYFRRVVGEVPAFTMLPAEQLVEVLASKDRRDLFIGGIVDRGSQTLALTRGDLRPLVVPLSIFRAAVGPKPDFRRFELDDYGYALRFGEYEASAHWVLFQADPDYRRRANAKRKAEERTFGASLRRLRILRGMSQHDFPGIASKTIGRIERDEIKKPHGATLDKIARALHVKPDEIDSY